MHCSAENKMEFRKVGRTDRTARVGIFIDVRPCGTVDFRWYRFSFSSEVGSLSFCLFAVRIPFSIMKAITLGGPFAIWLLGVALLFFKMHLRVWFGHLSPFHVRESGI